MNTWLYGKVGWLDSFSFFLFFFFVERINLWSAAVFQTERLEFQMQNKPMVCLIACRAFFFFAIVILSFPSAGLTDLSIFFQTSTNRNWKFIREKHMTNKIKTGTRTRRIEWNFNIKNRCALVILMLIL